MTYKCLLITKEDPWYSEISVIRTHKEGTISIQVRDEDDHCSIELNEDEVRRLKRWLNN